MATRIPENRAVFAAEEIVEATGGTARGPAFDQVTGVVTDSRCVKEGNLFVALAGERFDAHQFVGQALPLLIGAVAPDDSVRFCQFGNFLHPFEKFRMFGRRRSQRRIVTFVHNSPEEGYKSETIPLGLSLCADIPFRLRRQ